MNRPELLNTEQAAEFLGISVWTLYKYTQRRIIKFTKPAGCKNYFYKTDLEKFLKRGVVEIEN